MGEDPKYQDSLFCCAYLGGFIKYDKDGLPRKEYVVEGSKEERLARETLASLLRSQEPLNRNLREALAALFDPVQMPIAHPAGAREIVLKFRKHGRRRDDMATTMIAEHVWKKVCAGDSVKDAIESAIERFEKDESTVKKLWNRYRPGFIKIWGQPKGQ